MTLVEMLIAAGIGGLILAAVAALTIYSARAITSLTNCVDLDQYSRRALDLMSKEIRQANMLNSATATQLIFNTGTGTNNLSYTWSASAKTLTRTNGTQVEILLKECDSITFTIYGRNTASNSFDQFPVAVATNAKLVKVDWTCSRTLLGQKVNTESVQSAKIVIRKQ